jgi:predicted DNA-binding transcriptional regulator AlpA
LAGHVDRRVVLDAECELLTGYSRGKRLKLEKEGLFPRHAQLGPHPNSPSCWFLDEIMAWIEERRAERDRALEERGEVRPERAHLVAARAQRPLRRRRERRESQEAHAE